MLETLLWIVLVVILIAVLLNLFGVLGTRNYGVGGGGLLLIVLILVILLVVL